MTFELIRSVGGTLLVFLFLYLIVKFTPPRDPEAFA